MSVQKELEIIIIPRSPAAFSKYCSFLSVLVYSMQRILCDCDSELQLQTNDLDVSIM